jgi:replicative DNA helicase
LLDHEGQPIPDLDAFEQYAELHVVKQNEGPVGMIRLRFIKEFARLEGVTQKLFSNNPDERQEM